MIVVAAGAPTDSCTGSTAMMRRPLKAGDVYPAHVLRDEYGMNAANRPTIVVREEEVPEDLRHLIPYAERWAISCDVTRGDYFDHQPEADVAAFWHEVLPHVDAVNQWLDALGDDVGTWPEAGVHFLYLLKAHGEAYQPTAEEQQAFEARRLAWEHDRRRKEAVEQALEAFRQRDYPTVASLLVPFEAELETVPAAKLAFARKKLTGGG
jgi:hypothetical protein